VDNSNGTSANDFQQLQGGAWNQTLQVSNRHSANVDAATAVSPTALPAETILHQIVSEAT